MAQNKITVQEAAVALKQNNALLIDVRGFDEFAAGHVPSALCLPLSDLERRFGEIPTDQPVLVLCHSGGRSALAAAQLRSLGMDNVTDVAGGFQAWRKAGLPSKRQTSVLPLERQVRIAAGLLVLSFCVTGLFISPHFFYGAALIGFMLALTGALDICPMMSVLKLMPWNRAAPQALKE